MQLGAGLGLGHDGVRVVWWWLGVVDVVQHVCMRASSAQPDNVHLSPVVRMGGLLP